MHCPLRGARGILWVLALLSFCLAMGHPFSFASKMEGETRATLKSQENGWKGPVPLKGGDHILVSGPRGEVGQRSAHSPLEKKVSKGEELLRKRIGSGADEIGCERPHEGNQEGPMSFAIGEDGTIYVLDQVNERVQVFRDNVLIRTIGLPSRVAGDLEVTHEGKILLLDNLKEKALFVLDGRNGKLLSRIALEGPNIPYGPSVFAIYFRKEGELAGVWAEVEGRSVRLTMADGSAPPRRVSVPGLLSAKAKRLISASILGDMTVEVNLSKERFSEVSSYTVRFDLPVVHILALHMDQDESAYVAVHLEEGKKAKNMIVKLDREGKECGRMELPLQRMEDEVQHPIKMDSKGNIYQMLVEKTHVVILKHGFQR
jgi:hypothetical protein